MTSFPGMRVLGIIAALALATTCLTMLSGCGGGETPQDVAKPVDPVPAPAATPDPVANPNDAPAPVAEEPKTDPAPADPAPPKDEAKPAADSATTEPGSGLELVAPKIAPPTTKKE